MSDPVDRLLSRLLLLTLAAAALIVLWRVLLAAEGAG
jgi:hypothetical protein